MRSRNLFQLQIPGPALLFLPITYPVELKLIWLNVKLGWPNLLRLNHPMRYTVLGEAIELRQRTLEPLRGKLAITPVAVELARGSLVATCCLRSAAVAIHMPAEAATFRRSTRRQVIATRKRGQGSEVCRAKVTQCGMKPN